MALVLVALDAGASLAEMFAQGGGPFEEPPWIAKVFGAFLGLILVLAVTVWIVFAPIDLYRRDDIGVGKKLLWLIAFVLSLGIGLIIYGAVRFSRTDGHPGW